MNSNREEESKSSRIQKLKTTIHNLNIIVARLRMLRDLYRFNTIIVTTKNKELKAKIKALTVKETVVSKPLNFDAENALIKMKFSTKIIIAQIGNNKKYFDVPLFYDDKDQ